MLPFARKRHLNVVTVPTSSLTSDSVNCEPPTQLVILTPPPTALAHGVDRFDVPHYRPSILPDNSWCCATSASGTDDPFTLSPTAVASYTHSVNLSFQALDTPISCSLQLGKRAGAHTMEPCDYAFDPYQSTVQCAITGASAYPYVMVQS